ncbi:hypothetical protein APUTEX25_004467 [Auxenochlorella protothecoides]|uniref:Dephospho-CoA kinase n=1 Tax=Auxenochlorella protothecoides TaxID=3075 RepID=A0A3M7KZU9_AUXPR|nr:hypothetical protein APUTEX25_004467 [Auxenochlorella protothecoides]|eukprot:RMZ56043.1 hypothetical protein APUTEX25_004467 [Auxenochlorella protothecoides]
MKIVGLSGGIATGKSTFAAELRTLKFPVIDSDDIAKLVVKKIVDMPLLFETGFYHFTSPRLLVAAGEGMQRRRLMARDGLSEEAADVRVSSQMPLSAKRRLADIVVENDGDVEELRQSARTVGGLLQRHRWLHIWFFSPLGLGLVAAALFSLR